MVRWAKAASIWPSMPLSALPSRPISVSGSEGTTRRLRSPAAMVSASSVITSSGRSPRRTSTAMAANRARITPRDTASSISRSDARVALTESSRVATTRVPPGSGDARRRYWGPWAVVEETVTAPVSGL